MASRVNYAGLVVAGVGFFSTRFTATLAVYDDPVQFYLAGVVPLVLGLGLASFGVALAVGDVSRRLVRTTAVWCVAGSLAMLSLVALTLLGTNAGEMPALTTGRAQAFLANVFIGGGVGGTLIGLYAARNHRQRLDLRQQANRLEVLNRMLRHEILNSLTAIQGYAALHDEDAGRAREVIDRRTDAIEATVEEVKYLTTSASGDDAGGPIALEPSLEAALETIRERYPEAELAVVDYPDDPVVVANERLEEVFVHLLENAVVHGRRDRPAVEVSVAATPTDVRVSITDDGPGLPEAKRELLEYGRIGEFDDPKAGFGLNVVRLLVESYRGSIDTTVGDDGSTVTVTLRRADEGAGLRPDLEDQGAVRISTPRLVVTVGAALLAGTIMGVATELLGGNVPVIGALYGVQSPIVGWITHEFHSVVFGFAFAGILTVAPARLRDSLWTCVGLGVAWGVVLWAIAGGVVMATWLNLVGIPAPVPSLSVRPLITHVVWGVSIGALVSLGYERVAPGLAERWQRLRGSGRRSAEF